MLDCPVTLSILDKDHISELDIHLFGFVLHVSLSLRDFRYCTPHSTDFIKPLYTSVDTSLSSSSQHPLILCFLLGQGLVDRTSWHMESKLVAEHRLPDMTEGDYSPPILHPARLPQAHST